MALQLLFNPLSNSFDFIDGSGNYWSDPVADKTTLDAITTDVTGSVRIVLDTSDAYSWNGSAWIFVSSVKTSAIGSSPNANGFSVSSANTLTLQPANASFGGILTASAQDIAGDKTFTDDVNVNGVIDVTATGGTDNLNIGTVNADVVNIGNSGATINIQGSTFYQDVTNVQVADKLITVNVGGSAGSATSSGVEVEENALITGYVKTSGDRNSWVLKAPNTAGDVTLTPGASGITVDQSSHDPVTLAAVGSSPNGNGASLSTQQLTLQPADSTNPGVMTAGAQSLGGAKTLTDTTQSTSKDTGALILEGGIGVEKNAYVGGILSVTGNSLLTTVALNGALDSATTLSSTTPTAITGTVSTTNGSSNVTGSGTKFLTDFKAGQQITTNGQTKVIAGINSDTSLDCISTFTGSAAGVAATRDAVPNMFIYPNGNVQFGGISRSIATTTGNGNQVVSVVGTAANAGDSASPTPQLGIFSFCGAAIGSNRPPSLLLGRARGTSAAPSAIASDDTIGDILFRGAGTSGTLGATSASISAISTQAFTDANKGGKLVFSTSPNGSASVATAFTLDQDKSARFEGNVGIKMTAVNTLDVTGTFGTTSNALIGGTLGSTGNFAVNTNKFTVAASTGNTLVAGTLDVTGNVAVNTNKFTVAASSGDTVIAGTLNVTGSITGTTTGNLVKASGDLNETSFSAANNQASAANVTGLTFAVGVVRSARVLLSVFVDATSDLFEAFELLIINKGSSFDIAETSVGDDSGFTFTITSAGQVQYTNGNYSGFSSATIKFRAVTTSV